MNSAPGEKVKGHECGSSSTEQAMTSHRSFKTKTRRCTYCGRLGHIKKFCRELKADQKEKKEKPKAATTTIRKDSDSESSGLIASRAL